MGAAITEGTD